jgi:MOSC domain-containing protein YiiM
VSRIVSIVHTPHGIERRPEDHYARVPLDATVLVVGQGIQGDRKGTSRERQLNIMSTETLASLRADGFRTGPGQMGEQIVVSGIEIDRLPPGAQLRLGEAVVEVTLPRTGCDRFALIQGHPISEVNGRLGVMARVVVGGAVRVGDAAAVLKADGAMVP